MTPEQIIDAAESVTGYGLEDLRLRSRTDNADAARRAVAFLLMREAGLSSPAVARMLRRDHSTILNLARTAEDHFGARWVVEHTLAELEKMGAQRGVPSCAEPPVPTVHRTAAGVVTLSRGYQS